MYIKVLILRMRVSPGSPAVGCPPRQYTYRGRYSIYIYIKEKYVVMKLCKKHAFILRTGSPVRVVLLLAVLPGSLHTGEEYRIYIYIKKTYVVIKLCIQMC